jgi:hypothetical protein
VRRRRRPSPARRSAASWPTADVEGPAGRRPPGRSRCMKIPDARREATLPEEP